jgi:hypothetical protein
MFISECILPGEKLVARRQKTNALAIETSNTICISIMGATSAEVDAIAAAINAPIERMNREHEMQRDPVAQAAE